MPPTSRLPSTRCARTVGAPNKSAVNASEWIFVGRGRGTLKKHKDTSSSRVCRQLFQVSDFPGVPTRITELSVPKSSEVFTARGSATQRVPLTMNAYSCLPGDSGTDTAQTPGAPDNLRAVDPRVHSLKSPTSSTLEARESTKTKRTS